VVQNRGVAVRTGVRVVDAERGFAAAAKCSAMAFRSIPLSAELR